MQWEIGYETQVKVIIHGGQFGVERAQQKHQENWTRGRACSRFCASLFEHFVPGISHVFFFLWFDILEFHTAVVQLTGY